MKRWLQRHARMSGLCGSIFINGCQSAARCESNRENCEDEAVHLLIGQITSKQPTPEPVGGPAAPQCLSPLGDSVDLDTDNSESIFTFQPDMVVLPPVEMETQAYIAGWILRKIFKTCRCDICCSQLQRPVDDIGRHHLCPTQTEDGGC